MQARYRWMSLVLSLLFALSAGVWGQTSLRSPKINKRILLNGLTLLTVEQHQTPVVAIRLMIRSGVAFDPINKGGLADMTVEMLKAGTQQRSRQKMAEELQTQGVSIRTEATWDATYITGEGPAHQAGRILDLISDLVLNPAFPESEFKSFKTARMEMLKQQREDPAVLADQIFLQKLFEKTTYARPLLGTPPSVANIQLNDVKEFHKKFYLPNNAVMAIVGDVDPANIVRLAGRKIGAWVKDDVSPFTFLRPQAHGATKVYLIDKPDLSQAQVRVGHLGIARDNDDYFPFLLLTQLFSRRTLADLITSPAARSNRSAAATVQADMRRMPGPFVVRLSPPTAAVAPMIKDTIAALRQMKAAISPSDVDEAQRALIRLYAAQVQTPEQIAARLLEIDLYQLGSNYIDVYAARVERITSDDLRRVAERYFDPGGQVIVVMGNATALKEPLQAFGPVTILSSAAID